MSHNPQNESSVYCIAARFEGPKELLDAAKKTRDAGYVEFDAFSPYPIHGMDDATGIKPSKLPWIVLGGGFFGLAGGFGLQTWVATSAYKLIISGKPLFSYPAFIPVTFELMVLFSAFGAVFGMFALNKLPEFYHSIFNYKAFKNVSSHDFVLGIEAKDPKFKKEDVQSFLEGLGGKDVEVVES